jgi:hypothetical protein
MADRSAFVRACSRAEPRGSLDPSQRRSIARLARRRLARRAMVLGSIVLVSGADVVALAGCGGSLEAMDSGLDATRSDGVTSTLARVKQRVSLIRRALSKEPWIRRITTSRQTSARRRLRFRVSSAGIARGLSKRGPTPGSRRSLAWPDGSACRWAATGLAARSRVRVGHPSAISRS